VAWRNIRCRFPAVRWLMSFSRAWFDWSLTV
jgi:hypothetical protein